MSAIGAIFSIQGVQPSKMSALEESLARNPHDERGSWQSGPIALAACTLHTNAESRTSKQPYLSDDGRLAAVFDGYLLNPKELAEDLKAKGVRVKDGSDVEIALCAYKVWGDGCADRMLGEFAFIVADLTAGEIFAARDHIGAVPLYYRVENGRLLIASDFPSIAAISDTPLTPDHLYLAQIMTKRWYLREATPWKEVKRLVRAHTLRFDGRQIVCSNYWEPPTEVTIRYKSSEDYAEHYREVLFDCVRRASRTDRCLGVAVSGGLDSSALFAVADRLEKTGLCLAPSIAAYSLAAEEGGNAFELPYARAVAAHVGRKLTEVPLFDPDIDWYTDEGRRNQDLPIASNGAMMRHLEESIVADGGRVLINGGGGDEWLQGSDLYYAEYAADWDFAAFIKALHRDVSSSGWRRTFKRAARFAGGQIAPKSLREPLRRHLRDRRRRHDSGLAWLSADLRAALIEAEEAYEAQMPENALEWTKHNLAKSPFSDLSHSLMRRQRAAIGVESRHPMLSRAFMEFSLRTPIDIKLKGTLTKVVHRDAMRGLLPDVVVDRTTKANFTNTKIDQQFAQYVRENAAVQLGHVCDLEGLQTVLNVDFASPEGDFWAWEIWGLYASAAFLYQ